MERGVNRPVTCPACGTVATNPVGYCASCGQRLPQTASLGPPVTNPYAAPATEPVMSLSTNRFDPVTVKKVEAVIKDASQVVLAVLIGFLCTGFAWLLIGPWFFYRLLCWNRLAREYPSLLLGGAPVGSLEQRFQASRGRLIGGLIVGAVMLLFMFAAFAAMAFVG